MGRSLRAHAAFYSEPFALTPSSFLPQKHDTSAKVRLWIRESDKKCTLHAQFPKPQKRKTHPRWQGCFKQYKFSKLERSNFTKITVGHIVGTCHPRRFFWEGVFGAPVTSHEKKSRKVGLGLRELLFCFKYTNSPSQDKGTSQ